MKLHAYEVKPEAWELSGTGKLDLEKRSFVFTFFQYKKHHQKGSEY